MEKSQPREIGEQRVSGRFAILAIAALALLLRVWGLDFGLPILGIRSDEEKVVLPALCFFSGDYNPHLFNYPTLFLYLLHLVYVPLVAVGWLGQQGDWIDLLRELWIDPTPFVLVARGLSVAFGLGTLVLVWRIGLQLGSNAVGLLAAFFFGVAYLPVREAHFATVDSPQTFFVVATLWAAVRIQADTRARFIAFAAIVGGAAASTKYTGGIVVLPLLLAVGRWAHQRGRSALPAMTGTGLLAVGAFVCFSPYILIDHGTFQESFLRIIRYYGQDIAASAPAAGPTSPGWTQLASYLVQGLGWPLLITSSAGLVLLVRRGGFRGVLIAMYAVAYFGLMGVGKAFFFRYSLPLAPPLCLAAGFLLTEMPWRSQLRFASLGRAAIAILVAAPTLWASLYFVSLASKPETRNDFVSWVRAELPLRSTLVVNAPLGPLGGLALERADLREQVEALRASSHPYHQQRGQILERLLERFPDDPPQPRYSVLEVASPPFELDVTSILEADPATVYLVLITPTPWAASARVLEGIARNRGEEVARFCGFEPSKPGLPEFDPLDTFYFPLSRHTEVRQAGPEIRVFHLRLP